MGRGIGGEWTWVVCLGLLVILPSSMSVAGAPLFAAPVVLVPGPPIAVVSDDFDRDGIADLAVLISSFGDGHLVIRRGIGGRRFTPAGSFAVGPRPMALATGNIDGDTIPDLAALSLDGGIVSIFLGRGAGRFQPAPDLVFAAPGGFAFGATAQAMVLADLNADGLDDLLLVDRSQLIVALATGEGLYAPPLRLAAGDRPVAVRAADLDGDGNRDVQVAAENSGGIFLFQGHGDGTFFEPVFLPVSRVPQALEVADVDGDGARDLVMADFLSRDGATADGEVWVALADGAGGFDPARPFRVGENPKDLVLSDLNNDGHLDVITANASSADVSVLFGTGRGAFADQRRIAAGRFPAGVIVVDLDADGRRDLAVASGTAVGVPLLFADASGLPEQAVKLSLPLGGGAANLADFDDDGDLDIVGSSALTVEGELGQSLFLLAGDGEGRFAAPRRSGVGFQPARTVVADFNADGIDDLAVINSRDVSILLGRRGDVFAPETRLPAGEEPRDLATGDLDGNGHADLVVIHGQGRELRVWIAGPGGWTPRATVTLPDRGTSVTVADFTRDGLLDIVAVVHAGHFEGQLLLFPGNGDGSIGLPLSWPLENRPWLVRTVRLDRDPHPDLVVVPAGWDHFDVLRDFSSRTPLRPQRVQLQSPVVVSDLGSADLDGDGLADLVVTLRQVGSVAVFRGRPGRSLAPEERYLAGVSPAGIAIGDVNGDGAPDLAIGNPGDEQLSLLISRRQP